uniref:Uncharacterized protein n=1 Tax=Anopheles culicifacies TaxID=139723 RepID=A0A182MG62_9DIPT
AVAAAAAAAATASAGLGANSSPSALVPPQPQPPLQPLTLPSIALHHPPHPSTAPNQSTQLAAAVTTASLYHQQPISGLVCANDLSQGNTGELVNSASTNGLCCSQQLCYCGHCYQTQHQGIFLPPAAAQSYTHPALLAQQHPPQVVVGRYADLHSLAGGLSTSANSSSNSSSDLFNHSSPTSSGTGELGYYSTSTTATTTTTPYHHTYPAPQLLSHHPHHLPSHHHHHPLLVQQPFQQLAHQQQLQLYHHHHHQQQQQQQIQHLQQYFDSSHSSLSTSSGSSSIVSSKTLSMVSMKLDSLHPMMKSPPSAMSLFLPDGVMAATPPVAYHYANGQMGQYDELDEENYWSSELTELPVLVGPPLLPYQRDPVEDPLLPLRPLPSSSYPGTCTGPLFSVYLSPITPTTSTTAISNTITASNATSSATEVLACGRHYCTNSRTIITANTTHPAKPGKCGVEVKILHSDFNSF